MMHRYKLKENIKPERQSVNGIVLTTKEWKYFKEKVDKLNGFIDNIIDYDLIDENVEFQKKLDNIEKENNKLKEIQENEKLAKEREPSLMEKIFDNKKEEVLEENDLSPIELKPRTKQDYVNMSKKEIIDIIVESNPALYKYSDFRKQNHQELVLTVWNIKGLQ